MIDSSTKLRYLSLFNAYFKYGESKDGASCKCYK